MRNHFRFKFCRILLTAAAAVLAPMLLVNQASAQVTTYTWNAPSSTGTWETNSNWNPNATNFPNPFTNADAAVFGASGATTATLTETETLNSLTFSALAQSYAFNGSALTIDVNSTGSATPVTGIYGNETTGTETFNNNITIEDSGSTTLNQGVTAINQAANGGTMTFASGGTLTLQGTVSTGTNNNEYTISSGTGGTININGGFVATQTATPVILNGAGTINFNASYVNLTDNALTDLAGSSSSTATLVGGLYLGANGSSVVPTGSTPITVGGNSTGALLLAGSGQNDSAAVSGGGSANELVIFGSNNTSATSGSPVTNTYSGTFGFPLGGVSGATFEFYAGTNNIFDITGAFSGLTMNLTNSSGGQYNDKIVIAGGGTVEFAGPGANNAPITIQGGSTLQLGNANALGFGGQTGYNYKEATPSKLTQIAVPTVTAGTGGTGGTVDLNGFTVNSVLILNNGTLTNSYSSTAGATLSNGVVGVNFAPDTGAGWTTATSTVSFSGGGGSGAAATSVTGTFASTTTVGVYGITETAAGSGYTSAPTVTIKQGSVSETGTAILSSLSLENSANSIGSNAGNIAINAVVGNYAASVGGFSKIGTDTVTLNAVNTYTGPTQVNAGVLSVVGSLSSGTVTIGGSTASGTPTLYGTGSIAGPVVVATANGGVAGTITPGIGSTPGTLTVGNITFQTGSTFLDNVSGATAGLLSIGGAVVVQSGADFSVNGTLNTADTYIVATDTGGWSGTNGGFTLLGSNLAGWQLLAGGTNGDNLILEVASSTPTDGSYTLTTTAGATLLHSTATTTLSTLLTNTGTSGQDSLAYSGVGASATSGSVTGSGISGTVTLSSTATNTSETYIAGSSSGTYTVSLTGSITNVTASGTPTGSLTGTSIVVYTGQGVWNTNGGGTWGTTETATPANWTASGGVPGITPGFTTTDSAVFGTALTSGSATVTLSGASPYLNHITFNDTNAGTSYTIATGTGSGIVHLDAVGTATITNADGNNTISAPIEFDAPVSESVASSHTLTLSGNISQSGTQTFAIAGPGTTIISGSNTYSGGTAISTGSTFISNGSGSALGSGPLTVAAGATFGGSGSAAVSSYTIGAASSPQTIVQVGNGSDTISQLTLIGSNASSITNANLEFNLSTAGGANELAVGTTGLTLSGDTLTLNVTNAGVIPLDRQFVLIAGTSSTDQYSGITVGAGGVISGLNLVITGVGAPDGWYNNSYLELVAGSGTDDIDVVFVPEPSTWAMMLGGLATLVFWQRKRRSV